MTVHSFRGPGVDDGGEAGEIRPTDLADSPFEALRAAMMTPLPTEHFALTHPKRPEVEIRLRGNVGLDEYNEWRKGAKDPGFDIGYDLARLACILLANSSVDVLFHGRSTGMTLADPRVAAMYPQAADQAEAVRAFFDHEDLWLANLTTELASAWSGGRREGDVLRPTTAGQ